MTTERALYDGNATAMRQLYKRPVCVPVQKCDRATANEWRTDGRTAAWTDGGCRAHLCVAGVELRAVAMGLANAGPLDGPLGLVSLHEGRDGVDVEPLDLLLDREGGQEDLLGLRRQGEGGERRGR